MKTDVIEVPSRVHSFLRGFETKCESSCCGTRAFELDEPRLEAWVQSWGEQSRRDVMDALERLHERLHEANEAVDLFGVREERRDVLEVVVGWRGLLKRG